MPQNKSPLTNELLDALATGHRGAYISVNQIGLDKTFVNCTTKIFPPPSENCVIDYTSFGLSQEEADKIV